MSLVDFIRDVGNSVSDRCGRFWLNLVRIAGDNLVPSSDREKAQIEVEGRFHDEAKRNGGRLLVESGCGPDSGDGRLAETAAALVDLDPGD
jgi:hypothetical protein